MNNCKKCGTKFVGNYCPNCGTPFVLKRIDGRYIVNEIGSVLNFDKGILYTIRELILRPGINIRNFIQEDRKRLVKPIIFLIVCSLIYTLAQQLLHFEDGYIAGDMGESSVTKIFGWIQRNYGYANVYMGFFIALWVKALFRKSGFNIYEILILIFFIIGIGMLLYTLFGIAESVTQLKILHIGGIAGVIYSTWAIGQFFNKQTALTYVKSFLAYFLGWLTSMVLVIIVGFLIDWVSKSGI